MRSAVPRVLLRCAAFLLFPALLLLASCYQAPPSQGGSGSAPASRESRHGGITHDLSHDEDMGGHTLRKHVGRSDEQLRARLRHEKGISAASTYTDRAAAELAVGTALERDRGRVERWLERAGGRAPNLVLDYHGDQPIGRTMHHGDSTSQPCSNAKVVLRMTGPGQYYVLTSYPECR
jgi:Bacterial CdiA-CT RNAse A domain